MDTPKVKPGTSRALFRVRKVYFLPNLFTAMNLFIGLLAIYGILDNRLVWACWLMVLGGALDTMDGAVARLTHSTSDFGLEFDSLSDLVSFGVAPSLAAFHMMQSLNPDQEHHRMAVGICALYAICGALRLARYNVQSHGPERRGFLGLPIPAAALGIVFYILMVREYNLDGNETVLWAWSDRELYLGRLISGLMPFLVLSFALLMVSELPYPKVAQMLRPRRRMSFDSLVTVILVAVLLLALKSNMRVAFGFCLLYGYILSAPFMALWRWRRRTASPSGTEPDSPRP